MVEKGKVLVPEVVLTCTCCEKPTELRVAKDAPWALCLATKVVYELQEGKAVRRNDLQLVGEAKIVDSNGKQVFPVPPPSTDELLQQTREDAGDKEPEQGPKTGVDLDRGRYY